MNDVSGLSVPRGCLVRTEHLGRVGRQKCGNIEMPRIEEGTVPRTGLGYLVVTR